MSVEFEGDNFAGRKYQSRAVIGEPTTPSMSNFFIKIGIAKNAGQAYKFLIFLLFLCVVLTVVIYYFFVVNAGHAPIPASAIYDTAK